MAHTGCVALAIFAMLAMASGQSLRTQFEEAFLIQEQHLTTDAQTLAQNVWNLVCDGCTFTTPSQQHNQTADKEIYFGPAFTDASPYLGLISSIGSNARLDFVGVLEDDVTDDDFFQNDLFASIMSNDFQQLQQIYTNFYQDLTNSWQTPGNSMFNATLSGGSGFGFGIQIDCNSTTLFTLGGGMGTGFSGSYGSMTAGGGGGAGVQGFAGQQQFFATGGGGGGGLAMVGPTITIPSWGTASDPGQMIDTGLWTKLSTTAAACYKSGGLLMRGAGGGGGGLFASVAGHANDDLDDDMVPTTAMQYGGGFGFSFTYSSPTGPGTATDPVVGGELGHAAEACHDKCSVNPANGNFYQCFCPCLKTSFLAIPGNPWAANIRCYGQ